MPSYARSSVDKAMSPVYCVCAGPTILCRIVMGYIVSRRREAAVGRRTRRDPAMSLPYTICFCCRGDALLMLYCYWPPARHRWNGLGGKREGDELPLPCIHREVWEEAGIDLGAADDVRFAGTVTWPVGADPTGLSRGMYAFVAVLPLD